MAKNIGTLAILSENATLLSENCSNCKCFGIHMLIVFVCTARNDFFLEKQGQSQGYKSISRDLNVPVSTVCNIIKRFTAHSTVANLPGRVRKSKMNEKLQGRIVRMVDKDPRLSSKQIQADLQTQGTTVSARTIRRHLNEKGCFVRTPQEDTTADTKAQKKQDWSLPKLM